MNVIITDQAAKFFNKLDRQIQQKLKKALSKLYDFPEVTNIKRLSGRTKKYRMRAGDWRIIFAVNWEKNIWVVITIAHRKDA